ncbi:MAG: TolC family protein [Myxococcales bacterium]|nr:TolC family protein [Myxococcales bacterium]
MIRQLALTVALSLSIGGCASTSAKPALDEVASTVKSRSGHSLRKGADGADDKEAERAIDGLLARPLTADAAVQVALLLSPHLRAKLEELSIARADYVQAGLLKNPVLGIGKTAWDAEHIDPNLFMTVEQDFLDAVTIPLRKRVAATELEATKLSVADEVLALAAETRTAFYEAQAAEAVAAMRALVDDAAHTAADIARSQHGAGNMNDLSLTNELGLAAQTGLERKRAAVASAVARETLNKHMGTWGKRAGWKLAAKLPDVPPSEPSLERLESRAIADRLDVAAARRNVQAMGYTLSLAKTTRWTGMVSVAVEAGRLRGSERISFGPSVSLEIPLFDQRQAQIAKLEAYHRRAEQNLEALAVDVRADVRAARARMLASRTIVEDYAKGVIPLRENNVRYSQEMYDAMLLGVYQLIQSKQAEYDAYREYIEAVRDYWIARSDLERAVGGRLGTDGAPRASTAPSGPSTNPAAGPSAAPPTSSPSHSNH